MQFHPYNPYLPYAMNADAGGDLLVTETGDTLTTEDGVGIEVE